MADKPKKNPDYKFLRIEVLNEVYEGLVLQKEKLGIRNLSDYVRPILNKASKGEI